MHTYLWTEKKKNLKWWPFGRQQPRIIVLTNRENCKIVAFIDVASNSWDEFVHVYLVKLLNLTLPLSYIGNNDVQQWHTREGDKWQIPLWSSFTKFGLEFCASRLNCISSELRLHRWKKETKEVNKLLLCEWKPIYSRINVERQFKREAIIATKSSIYRTLYQEPPFVDFNKLLWIALCLSVTVIFVHLLQQCNYIIFQPL